MSDKRVSVWVRSTVSSCRFASVGVGYGGVSGSLVCNGRTRVADFMCGERAAAKLKSKRKKRKKANAPPCKALIAGRTGMWPGAFVRERVSSEMLSPPEANATVRAGELGWRGRLLLHDRHEPSRASCPFLSLLQSTVGGGGRMHSVRRSGKGGRRHRRRQKVEKDTVLTERPLNSMQRAAGCFASAGPRAPGSITVAHFSGGCYSALYYRAQTRCLKIAVAGVLRRRQRTTCSICAATLPATSFKQPEKHQLGCAPPKRATENFDAAEICIWPFGKPALFLLLLSCPP